MVTQAVVRFFTMTCNSLAPCGHLSIGIHDTQAMRQVRSFPLLQGLHHCMHVVTQKHGICSGMYDLWWKRADFFTLYCFDNLIQVSWIHGLICSCLTPNGEFCSMTCQQVGYSQSTQGNRQFIYITLLNHIYDSVNVWCAQSDWHPGPKVNWIWNDQGNLVFIVALQPFHWTFMTM